MARGGGRRRSEAWAREWEAQARARLEQTARAKDARNVIEIWNGRLAGGAALWFFPTIGAAIAAECPWLSFCCPACGQIGDVDLRTLDRHPEASIGSLIPKLSCRRCRPNPPFVRLIGLASVKGGDPAAAGG